MRHTQIHIQDHKGTSLIEMMISLVIGLILLAGIANIFSSNKDAYRFNEALSEINDNGNFVLDYLTLQLTNAGFVPAPQFFPATDENNDGVSDKIDMEAWAYTLGTVPIIGNSPAPGTMDSITVNSLTDPQDPNPIDCVGNAVGAPGDFGASSSLAQRLADLGLQSWGISNNFTLAMGAKGRSALWCNGTEILEGVENIRILYGEDISTPPDGAVDIYSDANGVTDMRSVLTIRIAILVASAKELRPAVDSKSYQLLDVVVSPKNDRRLRKVMITTIKLRNRCSRPTDQQICV